MKPGLSEYFMTTGRIRRLIHHKLHTYMQQYNVSPAQTDVLLLLMKQPQPVQPKEVARCLQLTPGAVSQLIDSLVENGFVTREPSLTDRRSTTIRLSDASEEKLAELRQHQKRFLADMNTILTKEDIDHLITVQNKILSYLERTTNGKTQS